jgi:hypothetical protein
MLIEQLDVGADIAVSFQLPARHLPIGNRPDRSPGRGGRFGVEFYDLRGTPGAGLMFVEGEQLTTSPTEQLHPSAREVDAKARSRPNRASYSSGATDVDVRSVRVSNAKFVVSARSANPASGAARACWGGLAEFGPIRGFREPRRAFRACRAPA